MSIIDRLNIIILHSGKKPKELEEITKVDRMAWSNLKRKTIRANADHIEAICKIWPQYAYWLITGETIPEAGQISPEMEEIRKNLQKVG